jgi:WD40 repeat protein
VAIRIWDATSRSLLARLEGHSWNGASIAFSPDGVRIAGASNNNTIRIWDATSKASLARLEGHSDEVQSVAFSPDGARIASGSEDNTIRIWDASSGDLLDRLEGHSSDVQSVAFSPDGARIASGSEDKTICIWDANSGALLDRLEGHSGIVSSVAFSPDGERIASGSGDKTVRIWDANSNALLARLEHSDYVWSVAFSPDGARIASGSGDTIRIWDTNSGALLNRLEGHSMDVRSVAFSPDGTRIASASYDKTIHIWDASKGVILAKLNGHSRWVESVAFSPDGTQIASASRDNTIRIWACPLTNLDLYGRAIDGPVALRGRDLAPHEGNLYGRIFPMLPWRNDQYSRIAAANPDPAHAAALRMELCATGKSWRAGIAIWRQAQRELAQPPDSEFRRIYATFLITTARDLVEAGRDRDANSVLSALADALTEPVCKHALVLLPLQDLAMATIYPGTKLEAAEAARSIFQRASAWLPKAPIIALAARAPDLADAAEFRAFQREVCAAHMVGIDRLDRIPADSPQRLAIAAMALQAAGNSNAAEHAYRRLLVQDDSPWARAETIESLPWSRDEKAWLERARQAATY